MAFAELVFRTSLTMIADKLEAVALALLEVDDGGRALYELTGMTKPEVAALLLNEIRARPVLESLFDGTVWQGLLAVEAVKKVESTGKKLREVVERAKKSADAAPPALPPPESDSSMTPSAPGPDGP